LGDPFIPIFADIVVVRLIAAACLAFDSAGAIAERAFDSVCHLAIPAAIHAV
jgi:hypothetical protein